MEKVDAESIATAIVNYVQECGQNMDSLRGQGYDGASMMSGNISGVKARIQQIQPKAYYHHCRAHVLNLLVATSCKALPEIRNLFDSVSQLTWFLGGSAKRMAIVSRYLSGDDTDKLVISGNNDDEPMLSDTLIEKAGKKTFEIQKLCETRWTAKVDTLSLIAKYKSIPQSFQDILDESSTSASDARIKASANLRMLQSSQFIVALAVSQHILSFTRPLTQVLQKTDCDIIKAYQDASKHMQNRH
ncbi:zinc finger MYM-type protein 1-like [Mytilus edulis]|uniref:zinc finger MYM-type protein 1-like n=1 Tax=Mytilus edulis TaxID=6550 RepID=UPI0039EE75C9